MQDAKNRQNFTVWAPSQTLPGYIFATKARIDNRKKFIKHSISPTCPFNMVNFAILAAEIVSLLWGTTANFNGSRVLVALLHGIYSGRQPNFAALNRGRHLYSAGRSSSWALAHILVSSFFPRLITAFTDWTSTTFLHLVWCGLSANLECMSEMCCTRLAENTGRKKSPKIRHLGTISQLCRAISSHVSTIGKSLLNSNISSKRAHNMANFGPLTAKIDRFTSLGHPSKF